MAQQYFSLGETPVFTLPADLVRRLAGARDPDAALLYLYLLTTGGAYDEENAAACLGLSPERLQEGLGTLVRLAAVTDAAAPALRPEPAPHSPAELAQGLSGDADFRNLCHGVEELLGKVLSPSELNLLFTLYQELGLPADVLILAASHTVQDLQRRMGPGRRPTMRQVERTARRWAELGVNDTPRADAYLRALEQQQKKTGQILRALQIQGRSPSETEEKYIRSWLEMGFEADAVYKAYDITLVKTGGLKWSYLNSILKSWHQKGLHTPEEIERGDKRAPARPRRTAPGQGEYVPGEQELKAQEWLKNYRPSGKKEQ